eukprot:360643-Chlamydomonas_euryale.AAC.8
MKTHACRSQPALVAGAPVRSFATCGHPKSPRHGGGGGNCRDTHAMAQPAPCGVNGSRAPLAQGRRAIARRGREGERRGCGVAPGVASTYTHAHTDAAFEGRPAPRRRRAPLPPSPTCDTRVCARVK